VVVMVMVMVVVVVVVKETAPVGQTGG